MFCDLHLSVNAFMGKSCGFFFVSKLKASHQKCSAAVREKRKKGLQEIAPGKKCSYFGRSSGLFRWAQTMQIQLLQVSGR